MIIATNNQAKLEELKKMLPDYSIFHCKIKILM